MPRDIKLKGLTNIQSWHLLASHCHQSQIQKFKSSGYQSPVRVKLKLTTCNGTTFLFRMRSETIAAAAPKSGNKTTLSQFDRSSSIDIDMHDPEKNTVLLILLLSAFVHVASLSQTTGSSTISSASVSTQKQWQPKLQSVDERRKLRGLIHNREHIESESFHHIEFYCGDSKSMAYRFSSALGMPITGVTGQNTGNDQCVSYSLESGDVRFLLTAPYSLAAVSSTSTSNQSESELLDAPEPLPSFSQEEAHSLFSKHGIFARAVGLQVKDATIAFDEAVKRGAIPCLKPTDIIRCRAQQQSGLFVGCCVSEVQLYGDVVLRFISFPENATMTDSSISTVSETFSRMPFLPHLAPMTGKISERRSFGLHRIDHAVGNVPNLQLALDQIMAYTGFHEFAEFTTEDVGTTNSGLNSVVLASDKEDVLLPLNEPTDGKRKSQIQTFLEQNEGPGLQHLALKTNDIFSTIRCMREAEDIFAGFELMKRPSNNYYRELPNRLGSKLTDAQYLELEELGILADADDEGILLQIFTKPIGDRPTFFFEIIQRVGCMYKLDEESGVTLERPGCGGFGQGNFRELFKAIEDHEKTLKI